MKLDNLDSGSPTPQEPPPPDPYDVYYLFQQAEEKPKSVAHSFVKHFSRREVFLQVLAVVMFFALVIMCLVLFSLLTGALLTYERTSQPASNLYAPREELYHDWLSGRRTPPSE